MRTGVHVTQRLAPQCEKNTKRGIRCKRSAVIIGKRNLCRQHANAKEAT